MHIIAYWAGYLIWKRSAKSGGIWVLLFDKYVPEPTKLGLSQGAVMVAKLVVVGISAGKLWEDANDLRPFHLCTSGNIAPSIRRVNRSLQKSLQGLQANVKNLRPRYRSRFL